MTFQVPYLHLAPWACVPHLFYFAICPRSLYLRTNDKRKYECNGSFLKDSGLTFRRLTKFEFQSVQRQKTLSLTLQGNRFHIVSPNEITDQVYAVSLVYLMRLSDVPQFWDRNSGHSVTLCAKSDFDSQWICARCKLLLQNIHERVSTSDVRRASHPWDGIRCLSNDVHPRSPRSLEKWLPCPALTGMIKKQKQQ